MRIENKRLLREFAKATRCDFCGRHTQGCDPAHLWSRGAGRLDIRCNLMSLCRGLVIDKSGRISSWVSCHQDYDGGLIPKETMIGKKATIIGYSAADIEHVVLVLKRLPKDPRRDQVKEELRFMSKGGRALMVEELKEAGVEWES